MVRVGGDLRAGPFKALTLLSCPRTNKLSSLQAEQRLSVVGTFSISCVWEIREKQQVRPETCSSRPRLLGCSYLT